MSEFKNSNIGWVGSIPFYWDVIRGKYLFVSNKDVVGLARVNDYERLALTLNGVVKRSKEDNEGLQPEKFDGYQILRKNELVFKLIDLQNVQTSRVGLSPYDGIVSPAYIILKCNKKIYPRYAEKYFLMMWHNEIFNALGDSGVRSSLNSAELLELPVILPPYDDQIKIANFINEKEEEIDKLLLNIECLNTKLHSLKTSLIFETVTKGLNANVELKDSGAKWLGKVPNHWLIDKLKYHLSYIDSRNPGDKIVLSLYREYGVIPKDSRDDNYNVTSEDTSNYRYVQPDNFVVNKMKAWQGSVAVSNYEGVVSPAYYVYKFDDNVFYKKYFHYLLRSTYKEEFRRLSGGIREGQWDLSHEALKNVLVLIPPFKEQIEISEFLDKKCTEIDSLIEKNNLNLEKLKQLKKSIIFDYVTGKKEVML